MSTATGAAVDVAVSTAIVKMSSEETEVDFIALHSGTVNVRESVQYLRGEAC
jgi:hypothetical protein